MCGVLLGVLWLAVGIAKLESPQPLAEYLREAFGVPAPAAEFVGWGEVALGVAAIGSAARLGATGDGRQLRLVLTLSSLLALAAVLIVFLVRTEGRCGCFGALVQATENRRLLVAGSLILLGGAAWPALSRGARSRIESPAVD